MAFEVFVDGIFVGYVDNPEEFINRFKEYRRKGMIPYFVNIYYDEERNAIDITTRKGRILRPLIVVKNGKPLLTKEHLEKLE
ncbi:MAG: DNA-directed RNA polymerase subunit B, partial [Nanopusillaceae archaeon]